MKDELLLECVNRDINLTVPWYLITSYLYYREATPIISDETYDHLCKLMEASWFYIKHPHKHLISLDDLKAGTAYAITEYPSRAVRAAHLLLKEEDSKPQTLEDFFE